MRHLVPALLLCATLAVAATPSMAADLKVAPGDTIESVLGAQKDKRVTLRLRSGQELTGTVRVVGAKVVQLGAPTGREFFDAVVPLDAIEAVLVRTKD
jgi:hypothetical protein